MDENETDVIITSDFGSYDTIVPYDGDRNYMYMWSAIEFGDIEKAKELIDSGIVSNLVRNFVPEKSHKSKQKVCQR